MHFAGYQAVMAPVPGVGCAVAVAALVVDGVQIVAASQSRKWFAV
jgi:hypothetical protein